MGQTAMHGKGDTAYQDAGLGMVGIGLYEISYGMFSGHCGNV